MPMNLHPSQRPCSNSTASVRGLLLAIPLCISAHADERPRTPVPDARPVMLAALQASDGEARGVLVGESADAITRHFAASSPIYIDVSTIRRYPQPGCARLKVVFRQEGVKLPGAAAPRTQTIEFGINYCLDGLPPKSQT